MSPPAGSTCSEKNRPHTPGKKRMLLKTDWVCTFKVARVQKKNETQCFGFDVNIGWEDDKTEGTSVYSHQLAESTCGKQTVEKNKGVFQQLCHAT